MPLLGFKGEYLIEGYRLVFPFAALVVRPADSPAGGALLPVLLPHAATVRLLQAGRVQIGLRGWCAGQ